MNKTIISEIESGVQTITINRVQKRNSLTFHEFRLLTDLIEKADSDDGVKVIYITSNGEVFSAGIDFTTYGETEFATVKSQVRRLFNALIECSKIVVVGVNGKGIGIGLTMLLLADCVFCTENSTFSTPFMSVGLYPEGCSSYLFPKKLGNSITTNLLYASGELTAKDAKNFGIVLDVLPNKEDLHKKAKEFTLKIAKNNSLRLIQFKNMTRKWDIEKLKEVNNYEMDFVLKNSEKCEEFQNTKKRYLKAKF